LAAKVKQNIQNLSKVLEEGAVPDRIVPTGDGKYEVLGEAQTPAELAAQLELFLRAGDLANVVATARFGLAKWPGNAEVIASIALALSELARDYPELGDDVRAFAITATDEGLAVDPANPDVWLAKARVLLALGQTTAVAQLEDKAVGSGVILPPEYFGLVATAFFRAGDIPGGISSLVRSVEASKGDPGVKSVATDAMMREVLIPMLPITSRKAAQDFSQAVSVAAWIADGVPEAEAEMLKFRVWATQAQSRVFIGDLALKSFLGVLTGFIALPLYSKLASRPGWRVLNDGPTNEDSWARWIDVADGEFIEELHMLSRTPFAWQSAPGEKWPTRQQVIEHMTGGV